MFLESKSFLQEVKILVMRENFLNFDFQKLRP